MKNFRKKYSYPLLLIFLSLLPLFVLFKPGYFLTHDGDLQLARIGAYYNAIVDLQFPVRWGAELNSGYGHPVLIFMYPLPSYIGGLLYLIGFNFVSIFKIISAFSFVFANVAMYMFLRSYFKNDMAAFFGAVLYGFAPYRFLNLFVRGDFGEELSHVFVPLVLWSVVKIKESGSIKHMLLGSVFFALFMLSHNGYAMLFTPLIIGFWLLQYFMNKEKHVFILGSGMFFFGISMSAFFWLPALWESRYTHAVTFIGTMYRDHFPSITQLIYSSWGFGSNTNEIGGLSPQIGIIHWIIVFAFFILLSGKLFLRDKKYLTALYFVCYFFLFVFLMLPISDIVWRYVPFLKFLQFPWRLTGIAILCTSFLGAYLVFWLNMKRTIFTVKHLFIASIAIVLISVPIWRRMDHEPWDNNYYLYYPGDTTWHNQTNAIWTESNKLKKAKEQIEIIDGKAVTINFIKKPRSHEFLVDASTQVKILDNTVYFPGWQVFVDNQKTNIEFQDMNHRGLITFPVPKGKHMVTVQFKESPIRFIANSISISAFIFSLVLLLINKSMVKVVSR